MERVIGLFSNAKTGVDILAETIAPPDADRSEGAKRAAEAYFETKKRGGRLRLLTRIDEGNLAYLKEVAENVEVRHLDDAKGNFAVSDTEYMSAPSSTTFQPGSMVTVIYSDAKPLVDQNRSVFERSWNRAEPADQRIREIEEGVLVAPKVEVIRDPSRTQELYLGLIGQAKDEVLIIVPTANAFRREERIGVMDAVRAASERGVKVSIISPNSSVEDSLQALARSIESRAGRNMLDHKRILEARTPNTVTVLVVDRRTSLVIEKRDDAQSEFAKAIGVATLSTTNSTVLANVRFFETVWEEVELREREEALLERERRSREASELLQDILAHDMRNYVQISMASAEILAQVLADGAKALDDAAGLVDGVVKGSAAPPAQAQKLRADLGGGAKALNDSQDLVARIIKAADDSSDLIDRAKKLGKVMSPGEVELRPVDLESCIRKSISIVTSANPERRIDSSFTVKAGAKVLADDMLEEVFTNVLSNSVNYTARDEVPVEIEVQEATIDGRAGRFWKTTFTDQGKGIPDDLKEKVFMRYQNAASGTGLGLSIVYALAVERYSGEVRVRDRIAGDHTKGTVLEIWLQGA